MADPKSAGRAAIQGFRRGVAQRIVELLHDKDPDFLTDWSRSASSAVTLSKRPERMRRCVALRRCRWSNGCSSDRSSDARR